MEIHLANGSGVLAGSRFEHVVFHTRARRSPCLDLSPSRDEFPPYEDVDTALPALDGAELAFIAWLFERAGMNHRSYRPETLRRRVSACLRALRVDNLVKARQLLVLDPSKIPAAIGAVVIGVTSFFRDSAVFHELATSVLPALPPGSTPRRIWSIGCSDGEEIYSVAMLLAEMNLLEGAQLLATDCRGPAIRRVRSGLYPAEMVRSVDPALRERYFIREEKSWRIIPKLREAVQARVADVTAVREPGVFDLIFCRNMAMYLRSTVASQLWVELEHSLRPGGFLVLGKAERPMGTRLSPVAPCIYRKN